MSSKIISLTSVDSPLQMLSVVQEEAVNKSEAVESPSSTQWDIVPFRPIYDMGRKVALSHSRSVFISSQVFGAQHRWVAKLEIDEMRQHKKTFFPHAEEIAYKIAKLLKWNSVPKTKILHQFSLEKPNDKYQKYSSLMPYFIDGNSTGHPITFTFQAFIKGEPLPTYAELAARTKKRPDILPSSYQRAFLLDMILGKGDARGDNTMYNPETREIFEIDNEYLGSTNYEGVLEAFTEFAGLEIEKGIQEDLLKVHPDQLLPIQTKYKERDADLLSHQTREPISIVIPDSERIAREKWSTFSDNLCCIQKAIQSLNKEGHPVTLEQVKRVTLLKQAEMKRERSIKKVLERLKEMKAAEERLAKEKELRRIQPPTLSNNPLSDIHNWIMMGHCVVLHSQKANAHIYYQGEETSIEKLRVIYLDIAPSTRLLEEGEWPQHLEMVGIYIAEKEFQKQLTDPSKQPREVFHFQIGYKAS